MDVTTTTVVITGLTNGSLYYILLKAKNSAGTSNFGAVVSRTPQRPPSDYSSSNIGTLKGVPFGTFQRDSTSTNISTISKAFRISKNEITRAPFLAIMGSDPTDVSKSSGTSDQVHMVNWYHAIAFCNKLSIEEGLTPVYTIRGSTVPDAWDGTITVPTSTDANVLSVDKFCI